MSESSDRGRIIHRGEGPYPRPCGLCGQAIEAGERYVLRAEGSILHEPCDFFEQEDAGSEEG